MKKVFVTYGRKKQTNNHVFEDAYRYIETINIVRRTWLLNNAREYFVVRTNTYLAIFYV
jgi:hypothetical protein